MTPEEAIQIETRLRDLALKLGNTENAKAHSLSIETLKYYQELKRLGKVPRHWLLPGETKE